MIAKRSFVVETENSKALSEYLQQEAFVVANLTKIVTQTTTYVHVQATNQCRHVLSVDFHNYVGIKVSGAQTCAVECIYVYNQERGTCSWLRNT